MSGTLTHVRNPLAPQLACRAAENATGLTVSDILDREGWGLSPSTVLVRDGKLVKRRDWDLAPLRDGEIATLVTLPMGGPGAASQIARVVATIALMVAAFTFGGPLAGALGITSIFGSASAAAAAGTLAITVAGQILIQALLPAPKPFSGVTPSPTYSLSAQSNQGRLMQAIPELFGRCDIFCDLASQPYFDFNANTQELFELFVVGTGYYEIEQILVDENVIWEDGNYTGTYPEIEIEIIPPGQPVTLFPDDVITSEDVANILLYGTDYVAQPPNPPYVWGWSGPFVASPPGTEVNAIAIDISFPGGLYEINQNGKLQNQVCSFVFQAQLIDDNGAPLGAWFDIVSETLWMQDTDPIYLSYRVSVPLGRYWVQGEKTTASGGPHNVDGLYWVALRSFVPTSGVYPNITLIAIRATATIDLNGNSAQKFNVVATRILPIWTNGAWQDPQPTRLPGPAACYLLKTIGGLTDDRIDLEGLDALDSTWVNRGDYFDGVFDTQQSLWQSLQSVLLVGGTRPLQPGSMITFVRDEAKTVPRAGFSPRNMISNSFAIDYMMFSPNTVTDAITVQYIDSRTWTQNQVLCALPGSTATLDTAPQLQFLGIVDYDHAWREGIYTVASNFYRRVFPSFTTELEGLVCFLGDLIQIGHWVASWGIAADAIALEENGAGDIVTLSEPWSPPEGEVGDNLITLASPDGQIYGPATFSLLDDGSDTAHAIVQLTSTAVIGGKYAGTQPRDWPVWSGCGLQLERPRCVLGVGTQTPQNAIVVSMQPGQALTATVNAVIDDPRVYAADTGIPPVDTSGGGTGLDLTITALTIIEADVVQNSTDELYIVVTVSGASERAEFRLRILLGRRHLWSRHHRSAAHVQISGLGRHAHHPGASHQRQRFRRVVRSDIRRHRRARFAGRGCRSHQRHDPMGERPGRHVAMGCRHERHELRHHRQREGDRARGRIVRVDASPHRQQHRAVLHLYGCDGGIRGRTFHRGANRRQGRERKRRKSRLDLFDMTMTPLQAVQELVTDAALLAQIIRGDDTVTVNVGNGVIVPSIANVMAQLLSSGDGTIQSLTQRAGEIAMVLSAATPNGFQVAAAPIPVYTLTFPVAPADGNRAGFSCNQNIAQLIFVGTVMCAPGALQAGQELRYRYSATDAAWLPSSL